MNTKRTSPITFLAACLTIFATLNLFATSAIASASTDNNPNDAPAISGRQANADNITAGKNPPMTIIHESTDILHYENGAPYIHDILTNNTDRTIIETQYCILAYDKNGSPLKLYWNFLDSSAESSYENFVQSQKNILSNQTEEYRGGWSLYDDEIMERSPKDGDSKANQVAYSLVCLKQVIFEDGTFWNNPDFENWFKTYAGKETDIDELQNYYPHEYKMESD